MDNLLKFGVSVIVGYVVAKAVRRAENKRKKEEEKNNNSSSNK